MLTVNIGELKNHLSAYLQKVKNGEEIIIKDRSKAVARILPLSEVDYDAEMAELVADGIIKPARKKLDLNKLMAMPGADVSPEKAIQAVLDERAEGW